MISVILPVKITEKWQIPMTRCAIDTLVITCWHKDIEIIIVESAGEYLKYDYASIEGVPVTWVEGNKGSYSADWNYGANHADNDILLHTGNDIFARPGWDEALIECLNIPDCGVATILTSDIAHAVKPINNTGIGEGVYGPFMAFKKEWRLDDNNFPNSFSDTDLIMRAYKSGLKSYRNYKTIAHHLLGQTLNGQENQNNFERGRRRFIELHRDSPLLMYKFLSEGGVI